MTTTEAVEAWLADVLPAGFAAVVTRLAEQPTDDDLWPDEQVAIASAVDRRRHEFIVGRRLARRAMERIDVAPKAIPVGQDREPIWPDGLVGSITHSRELVGVAVGPSGRSRSIGLDFEPVGGVDSAVATRILTEVEQDRYPFETDPGAATVIFSAKEAVYKTTFPLTGRWLGFEDAEIILDPDRGRFEATLRPQADHPMAGQHFQGWWTTALGHVLTVVAR